MASRSGSRTNSRTNSRATGKSRTGSGGKSRSRSYAGSRGREAGASFPADLIRAVIIALFIIFLAVVLVLYFRPLYYLDISLFHLDTACGLHASTVRRNYDVLIDYMLVWNRGPLVLPNFAMSEHGRIHFEDCKRIFDIIQILCLASGILTLIGAVRRKHTSRCLRIAGILTIVLPAALGLFAFFQWERLFVTFHTVLFRNDYWLFDPRTDPVIIVLPDGFFFQCAVGILIIVLAGGMICLVRAHRKSGYSRRR